MAIVGLVAAALIASRGILLFVAVIGTISSTVFLGMTLVAAVRHRRASRQTSAAIGNGSTSPAVTLLKPVHGAEPRLYENLESFFLQDYPDFEIVFGARSLGNDALRTVEALCAKYPHVRTRVLFSGEPEWPNAKVYSLDKMIASSRNSHFIITDSDIWWKMTSFAISLRPLVIQESGVLRPCTKGFQRESFGR